MAGCATPGSGLTARRRSAGVPDPEPPVYREWLPAPDGARSGLESASRYVDVGRTLERGGTLSVHLAATAVEFWAFGDWFGHDVDEIDGMLIQGSGPITTIYAGDVSIDDAAAGLEASGYDPLITDDAQALFRRRDHPRIAAVSSEGVVQTTVESNSDRALEDAIARTRAFLDAKAGERSRRHEADDAFARVTDALGAGIRTTVPRSASSWLPAGGRWGTAIDATDDGYVRRATAVGPHSGSSSTADGLESRLDEFEAHVDDVWDGSPTVYGDDAAIEAVVVAEADRPAESIDRLVPPRATLAFAYDDTEDAGVVAHRAGEAIETERLSITVNGRVVEDLRFESETFDAGDRFAIRGLNRNARVSVGYLLADRLGITLETFDGAGASLEDAEIDRV
ncbi:hypothetical protein EA472_18095 [Natrarchaeobius oligotrophus]|uniref:Uncharacterized protein n=1 Tax=Natrarchaeobius chitinivorans TaxID=1679083 RepID=A0A3N6M497_NATCH|nr:hypothetical protein EA472_18095 [Natrarchaeobius chitinivorans]